MRKIGDGEPCFLTFEAGPTHDGLDMAKRLADVAAEAGADAIKFQMVDPDRLVADRKQMFSYKILTNRATGELKQVEEPLYDLLRRRALERGEWTELKAHCDGLGLAFFATIAFEDELEFVAEMGCHGVKIASADVNFNQLLRAAARTGMQIQLDTGNATIGEIETAIDVIRAVREVEIVVHHCPSGYPASADNVNLNIIPSMKRLFGIPIAYSDHYPGWEMDIAAITLGANLIEKTITLDRMTPSVEHVMSLEPDDARRFVKIVRDVERGFGSSRRHMSAEQIKARNMVRRSAFLSGPAKAGAKIEDLPVIFRRPGTGIAPDVFETLSGMTLRRDLPEGAMLQRGDLG
jgi:sialic acid synthase SpsE